MTAAMVATSLVVPWSSAAADEPDPQVVEPAPVVTCTDQAADSSEASTVAVACDQDVEVVGERTEWNTVYAQADGTMRLDVSALAVRTQVDGDWGEIDATVVAASEGITVAAPVRPMVFSDGTDGMPLARITREGQELTFDVPFDLPSPALDGDQLTYDEVLPGVDLVVSVNDDATGFSEVFRVEDAEAAANPLLAELSFPVETSDALSLQADAGGFVAVDAEGTEYFTSPTPAMWDSRDLTPAPVVGARTSSLRGSADLAVSAADAFGEEEVDLERAPSSASATAELPAAVAESEVSITPDPAMIDDDSTVWPVYIDPAISGSLNDWTAVRDVFGQSYRFNPDEGVGLCNRATSTSCTATFKSRILWKFGGLASIGAMNPSDINGTTFAVVGTHSYDCTPRAINLYRVDNWSSATAWPANNYYFQSSLTVAHKSSCAGQPVRWLEFPALEAGQAVANANSNQLTMGLATDESSMAYWKRYRNDAGLSISYNRAPTIPTGVKFSSPAAVCTTGAARPVLRSATPVLYAVLSDPDGQAVQANVDVYAAGTSTPILWHARPAAQASGVGQSIQLGGMTGGKIYRVQINGVDPNVVGGPAVACEVEIDLVAPAAPTIKPVAVGTQPVYTTGVPAGGLGKTGSFQFGNGGSADVVSYKYSLNSSALNLSTTAAQPTVAVTPTSAGSQTLYFQSVDRAGWTSPMQSYTFSVAFPETTVWRLDETAGMTAASSGDPGTGFPMTWTGPVTRVDGPFAEAGINPADRAVLLGPDAASGATALPVMRTSDSFAVQAIVRADAVDGTAAVAYQSGTYRAGYTLGYRPCADGQSSCWAFAMPGTDAYDTTIDAAVSPEKVEPGQWTLITGVHDAGQDRISVWVCTIGDEPGDLEPTGNVTVPHANAWSANGPLRLGQTTFVGAVSELRTLTGAIDDTTVNRACNQPAA
ncbi:LamG domain-containing protein [Cellulomonas fimi]|uniref:LamG domain-containing protein n=1 Tax=Cellulomonas sp. RIT-PI-Y TaxID=3035297 RepID=UPI0021DA0F42